MEYKFLSAFLKSRTSLFGLNNGLLTEFYRWQTFLYYLIFYHKYALNNNLFFYNHIKHYYKHFPHYLFLPDNCVYYLYLFEYSCLLPHTFLLLSAYLQLFHPAVLYKFLKLFLLSLYLLSLFPFNVPPLNNSLWIC